MSDEETRKLTEEDATFSRIFGTLLAYYVLAGTVVIFIVLNWLSWAQPILDALGPFRTIGQGVLLIASLMLNILGMGLIVKNAGKIEAFYDQF